MSEVEVRTTSSTGGQKGSKLARHDLVPVGPLKAVAELFGKGAEKYSEHNWRLGYPYSLSYASLQRHAQQYWGGEDYDSETGAHHMASVIFHAMAIIEFGTTHPDFDDRYTTVKAREDQEKKLIDLKLTTFKPTVTTGAGYDATQTGATK